MSTLQIWINHRLITAFTCPTIEDAQSPAVACAVAQLFCAAPRLGVKAAIFVDQNNVSHIIGRAA